MAAWRNRTGPPSSVTTRSPSIDLPIVVPHTVSLTHG
jgi:hypothetical protein